MSSTSQDQILASIRVPSAQARFTNWGLTHTCLPAEVYEPESESHCQLVLEHAKRLRKRLRAVGVGHSPSDLACTKDIMIRMTKLNAVLEVLMLLAVHFSANFHFAFFQVDTENRVVVAQGGILLSDLHDRLAEKHLAMSSLGSISDQTIAGVIATATHGSGVHFGVISTQVVSLTLLLADGSLQTCSREENQDLFLASLCGLGATGLILRVQLRVEPAFRLKEINRNIGFQDLVMRLDEHMRMAEHVKFWWYPAKDIIRASYYNRTQEASLPSFVAFFSFPLTLVISPRSLLVVGCGTPSLGIMSSSLRYSSHDTSSL